jgi:uncharacterized protein (TIGR00251 family)
MISLELQAHPDRGSVSFAVRVQTRASKDEVAGVMDGALKIRLQAPAVEDRANQALCAFLAELLKRPKSAVRLLSGERSRTKCVEIDGVTTQEIAALVLHDV